MKYPPEISVIMSVYNGELYLAEAIESILHQTFKNFELIIIDDGSIDNSREIISSFCDKRIKVIENERNIGLAASLNKGASIAGGKYLARMDADDISLPDRFQKQKIFLDQHPDVGVLGTNAQRIDEQGNIIKYLYKIYDTTSVIKWSFLFGNPMLHPTILMRKDCFLQVGGYSSDVLYSQDYNLWVKMMEITNFRNLSEILLLYRVHLSNISFQQQQHQLNKSLENSRVYISKKLGREISIKQVNLLRRQKAPENENEVLEIIRMINQLFFTSIIDEKCTRNEKRIIRKDAWRRVFLFSKMLKKFKNRWLGFYIAFRLSPYFTSKRIFFAVIRELKNRCLQRSLHGRL